MCLFPYILPAPFFGGKKVVQKVVQKTPSIPKLASFKVLKLQRGQLVRVRIIDLNQEEGKLQVSMLQPMPKMPGKKENRWRLIACLLWIAAFFLEQRWPRRGLPGPSKGFQLNPKGW